MAVDQLRAGTLDQSLVTTGFLVTNIFGTQIDYEYHGMPGNRPGPYGNTIYIWQTSSRDIPRNMPFKKSDKPQGDSPDGTGTFDGLTIGNDSYLLAYSVGNDDQTFKNICASVFVPRVGGGDPESFLPVISTATIGSTSVSYAYTMPGGSTPNADGDWVGLWQGQPPAALYTVAPTAFAKVPENLSEGRGSINNVTILRGVSYTLGYFKGGWDQLKPKQTTLACATTFKN